MSALKTAGHMPGNSEGDAAMAAGAAPNIDTAIGENNCSIVRARSAFARSRFCFDAGFHRSRFSFAVSDPGSAPARLMRGAAPPSAK
jgi:hypothetical protein